MESVSTELNPQIAQPRLQVYWTIALVMICCSVGSVCGRILSVQSEYNGESVPFFCANDRSRWCTVRSLVDHKTYSIDYVINDENSWDTIDKVRHLGADGEFHYYSSKPALLPTIVAGGYWIIKATTGKSIDEHPFFVVRLLLILLNGGCLFLALVMLARIAKTLTNQLGPALFVVACGCFGTYMTTFGVTFSNHVPAAACVMTALALFLPYWLRQSGADRNSTRLTHFVLIGLSSALAVAFDLPALSFCVALAVLCLLRCWASTVIGFIPGAGIVVAAFFWTNNLAHDTWTPAYQHRKDGPVVETFEGDFEAELNAGKLPAEIQKKIEENSLEASATAKVSPGYWPHNSRNRWVVDFGKKTQLVILQINDSKFQIRKWYNWYDYPGSYWATNNEKKSPVDRGVKDQREYLLHVMVGHHGIISLSPIFLLSWFGLLLAIFTNRKSLSLPAFAFLAITVVVIAFYIYRPQHDRNYGGWTSCFRWAIWMYPMWLAAMVPMMETLWSRRWMRWLAVSLLLLSAASAAYPLSNPWIKPWFEEFFFRNSN